MRKGHAWFDVIAPYAPTWVVQMTGVSRSTIYRWMENGEFPRQISLGANTVAWLEMMWRTG